MAGSRGSRRTGTHKSTVIRVWKTPVFAAAVVLGLPVLAMAEAAQFRIAAQPLPSGLKAFADQSNMEILYQYDDISGIAGNAVVGEIDKHEALARLLQNTGLEAVYSSDHAATIRRVTASKAKQPAAPPQAGEKKAENSQSRDSLRLARTDQDIPAQDTPLANAS